MPTRIDIVHAALAGFRLTRSKPSMVAVFALVFLIAGLIEQTALAIYAGPQLTALFRAWAGGGAFDALVPLYADLSPHLARAMLLCMPVSLMSFTLFVTAVWRGVLAPQQGGIGYVKFSMAELRQLMVLLLMGVFIVLAMGVMMIVMVITSSLVASASQQAGALVFLVAGCLEMALLVMIGVHLSMAGPASFDRGRVQVLSAWPIANHQFWPILAALLIASMLSVVVWTLGYTIAQAPIVLVGGGLEALAKYRDNFTFSLATLFSPLSLVGAVLGALFNALQMLILVSPVADLYRQIRDGQK